MPESSLDPQVLEFLELEAAGMNEKSDEFFDRYGFRHTCRCDKDYAEDNSMTVPACWVEMMDISFDRLAQNRAFLKELGAMTQGDYTYGQLEVAINDFLDG